MRRSSWKTFCDFNFTMKCGICFGNPYVRNNTPVILSSLPPTPGNFTVGTFRASGVQNLAMKTFSLTKMSFMYTSRSDDSNTRTLSCGNALSMDSIKPSLIWRNSALNCRSVVLLILSMMAWIS